MRIAMWSGPRNLSTAMMYSFGAREDFAVADEPFYAPYLIASGAKHPMRAEILNVHETDPDRVAGAMAGKIPDGKTHFYQKHMPHHMLPGFPMAWANGFRHVFLLRHPARVVASYAAKSERPRLHDVGFLQQKHLFDRFRAAGEDPIVIDSEDIREDPEIALRLLCEELNLPFDAAMLNWPAGGHAADGVWASHWYGAVRHSTGFLGPEGLMPDLAEPYDKMVDDLMASYLYLKQFTLPLRST